LSSKNVARTKDSEDAQPQPQAPTEIPAPKPLLSEASDIQVFVPISAVSTSAATSAEDALYTFLRAEEAQLVLQYLDTDDFKDLNGVGRPESTNHESSFPLHRSCQGQMVLADYID